MIYGFLLLIAVVGLAVRHSRSTDASERSKRLVVGLAAGSALTLLLRLELAIPAALLVSVGAYTILHKEIMSWDRDWRR
jgi:hypothetical protein